MEDLTNEEIYSLIETAIEYKKGNKPNKFTDKYVSNLFFETLHVQNAALKWLNVN